MSQQYGSGGYPQYANYFGGQDATAAAYQQAYQQQYQQVTPSQAAGGASSSSPTQSSAYYPSSYGSYYPQYYMQGSQQSNVGASQTGSYPVSQMTGAMTPSTAQQSYAVATTPATPSASTAVAQQRTPTTPSSNANSAATNLAIQQWASQIQMPAVDQATWDAMSDQQKSDYQTKQYALALAATQNSMLYWPMLGQPGFGGSQMATPGIMKATKAVRRKPTPEKYIEVVLEANELAELSHAEPYIRVTLNGVADLADRERRLRMMQDGTLIELPEDEEDENAPLDMNEDVQVLSEIFKGCVFGATGNVNQTRLMRAVKQHGGHFSDRVYRKTTHHISAPEFIDYTKKRVRDSIEYGVPFLRDSFVYDSIQAGRKLDEKEYLIEVPEEVRRKAEALAGPRPAEGEAKVGEKRAAGSPELEQAALQGAPSMAGLTDSFLASPAPAKKRVTKPRTKIEEEIENLIRVSYCDKAETLDVRYCDIRSIDRALRAVFKIPDTHTFFLRKKEPMGHMGHIVPMDSKMPQGDYVLVLKTEPMMAVGQGMDLTALAAQSASLQSLMGMQMSGMDVSQMMLSPEMMMMFSQGGFQNQ